MEQMTSKQMLAEISKTHYENARKAKAEGKPVVWSTSIAPQELLEAMGFMLRYSDTSQ